MSNICARPGLPRGRRVSQPADHARSHVICMFSGSNHTTVLAVDSSCARQHCTGYHTDPAAAEPAVQPLPSTSATEGASLPYFRTLLQQLDAVGWGKASISASASPDLKLVTLQLHDASGRCHTAEVHLPPVGFPIAAPTVTLQLPSPFKVRWLPGDTLATLVAHIEKVCM